MLNVLIIEDDEEKARKLEEFIYAEYPESEVSCAKSFSTGLRALIAGANHFDIVLLDMSMPSYDVSPQEPSGGTPVAFAGKELLAQMRLRSIGVPTIVVTMFDSFTEGAKRASLDQLVGELKADFSPPFRGYVYYNAAQEGWIASLKKIIDENVRRQA
jgi:DNA-binding LytR/AlgR family response regulator